MKILVCISKAPDTTSRIAFTEGSTKFDETGVQFIINPYDEWFALVRALEIKEDQGGTVTTITVGDASCDPVIRKALAIGADDAVRIDAKPTDAWFAAAQISEYAKDKHFDIVFLGKESIDYNGSQVGGMVSELMDLPYISLASKLEIKGNVAEVERDVQGGVEVLELETPFVISASKGMAEQRIPNMRGIMAARTKPLTVVPAADVQPFTEVVSFELPPAKADCHYVEPDNAEDLIQLLHNEAKAI